VARAKLFIGLAFAAVNGWQGWPIDSRDDKQTFPDDP
jgi:hypothetical protein